MFEQFSISERLSLVSTRIDADRSLRRVVNTEVLMIGFKGTYHAIEVIKFLRDLLLFSKYWKGMITETRGPTASPSDHTPGGSKRLGRGCIVIVGTGVQGAITGGL